MFWIYLGEVFKRALTPTPRITDGLQVIAASAFPAVSKFFGVKMPNDIANDTLAYIGAATLALIFIRLFWAPYSIWRELIAECSDLKSELSKPERLMLERLAEQKALAIQAIKEHIPNAHDAIRAVIRNPSEKDWEYHARKIEKSVYQSGIDPQFLVICVAFLRKCEKDMHEGGAEAKQSEFQFIWHLLSYLDGAASIEFLERQLPLSIAARKQM